MYECCAWCSPVLTGRPRRCGCRAIGSCTHRTAPIRGVLVAFGAGFWRLAAAALATRRRAKNTFALFEHMFETKGMTMLADPRTSAPAERSSVQEELQARIRQMQSNRLPERTLPMLDGLRAVLPSGLRAGATYSVMGSTSLA